MIGIPQEALDSANKFVHMKPNEPKTLLIFGHELCYDNVRDAESARNTLVGAVATELNNYSLTQRAVHSWSPLDVKGIG